jgi:hypothetical protein
MNLFDLYELPDTALFETPRYQGMREKDPYMGPLMEKRRNKAHTVYDQRLITPPAEPPSLSADWIAVARFAATAGQDAAVLAAFGGITGATRVRYATRGQDHPRNPTFRPRCIVITEWTARPDVDLPAMIRATLGEAVPELDGFIGQRVYPWPDRPA